MNFMQNLSQRRSNPSRQLGSPGPDAEQLRQLLALAVHVPDHGKLTPWRFLRIEGATRHQLGELLATRYALLHADAGVALIEKERARFSFAPLILTVIAKITPGHKVPEQEQLLSGGAVCFSLLQGAHALGFGAQWLTGWAAYDPVITHALGLGDNERVLGFIHIGAAQESALERVRPDPSSLIKDLQL